MASYLLVGPPANWKIGIDAGKWGLSINHRHPWERMAQGDTLFFYVTRPVSGLVGYGYVIGTQRVSSFFWPDESRKRESLWPLQIEFKIGKSLDSGNWENHRFTPQKPLYVQRSIQKLDELRARDFVSGIDSAFVTSHVINE